MEIKYFGYCCFRLKGKDLVLLTNPLLSSLGLKVPPLTADIIVDSDKKENEDLAKIKAVKREAPFVIDEPGEYEVGGTFILGLPGGGGKPFFIITMDGLRLAFLGDQKEKFPDKQLEEVDGVDILFLPVGGKSVFTPQEAVEVVNQIEPKIIIPMAYKIPQLNLDLAPVADFLKEMGMEEIQPLEKLITSKDKLPLEKEVIVLSAKS